MLKIALTKGRTEKQVIPLLEKSGVDCSGLLNKKRRLIVSVADKYQFVLAKGPDVSDERGLRHRNCRQRHFGRAGTNRKSAA